jgi:Type II secretion system (T2SS), protein E, N-terminal domain
MRLGEWLVAQGTITLEQLEAALRAQVVYGGRLGTNLIEQGAIIDLDLLAQALAARAGVPPALQRHLENVDPGALALVPSKLAARYHGVPLGFTRSTPRRLAVAFIDPLQPGAADEIGMVSGHGVLPSVACELRIHYHLERLYGIARPNRFVRVEDAAHRHREARERRRFVEIFPSVALGDEAAPTPPTPAPPVIGPGPARPYALSASFDVPPPWPQPAPASPTPRPRAALVASAAIAAIANASDRDAVGDVIIDHLRTGFAGGIVLIVRKGMALGWKGFAPSTNGAVVEAIALPLGEPSLLKPPFDSGTLCRGEPAQASVLNALLWKVLKLPAPRELVVAPIAIDSRVVNLVYGHPAETLSEGAVSDLAAVCSAAASAFTRLIQAAKLTRS